MFFCFSMSFLSKTHLFPNFGFSPSLFSVAVGVGFYGNSETNDGVYQLTYSVYNANHSLGGVDSLVCALHCFPVNCLNVLHSY